MRLFSIFLLLLIQISFAKEFCGTKPDSATLKALQEDRDQFRASLRMRAAEDDSSHLALPLTLHIVRMDDGTTMVDENKFFKALERTNNFYARAGISFFVAGDIQYHNNSTWHSQYDRDVHEVELLPYNVENTINVWVIFYGKSLTAYARFPEEDLPDLIMTRDWSLQQTILEHEFGHSLGLLHTHDTDYGKELVARPGAGVSNCESAGDGFCSTPADPGLNDYQAWEVDDGCVPTNITTQTDDNGDLYTPDGYNLMSYSHGPCRSELSDEQIAFIRWTVLNNPDRRKMLDHGPSLDSLIVPGTAFTGAETVLEIVNSMTVDSIKWSGDGIRSEDNALRTTVRFDQPGTYTLSCELFRSGFSSVVSKSIEVKEPFAPEALAINSENMVVTNSANHSVSTNGTIAVVPKSNEDYFVWSLTDAHFDINREFITTAQFGVDLRESTGGILSLHLNQETSGEERHAAVQITANGAPLYFALGETSETIELDLSEYDSTVVDITIEMMANGLTSTTIENLTIAVADEVTVIPSPSMKRGVSVRAVSKGFQIEGNTKELSWNVVDMKGKIVSKGSRGFIPTASIASGIYLIQLQRGKERLFAFKIHNR